MPTFNRAHTIDRAIHSVLQQTHASIELIIVDDGSTDGTASVVARWADPRVRYIALERNSGCAAARNAGIARATGRWLAFQDSDDEWLPHKLETQLRVIREQEEDPELVGVVSTLLRYGKAGAELIRWPRDSQGVWVEAPRTIEGLTAYLQSLLLSSSVVTEVGAFDTKLRTRSDYELVLRLLSAGRLRFCDDVLAFSHESHDGVSTNWAEKEVSTSYLLDKHKSLLLGRPDYATSILFDLAKVHLFAGNASAARYRLRQALVRNPRLPKLWLLLAMTLGGSAFVSGLLNRRASRLPMIHW